ncbi:type II toxin-antitoxin system RelE/ParE family toxin [Leptospira yasudae]|uniref:Peptidase n=1 Tax=Leptospira yasudae TaxID=2202201 RepID=A0ABX9M1B5_9LEPT|nr:type II toxin-antitoxin system RelE/ParE family toxin [Leptospira yasudae]RHX78770.1 peptidase [Leptospira yasudae]
MIISFKHKGLEQYFETGSKKGIQPDHSGKLGRILDRLDASLNPKDMDLPSFKLHQLKGKEQDRWSVWVNGNWRVTFEFEGENAILVDYEDYH